jgi:hypothetical protein
VPGVGREIIVSPQVGTASSCVTRGVQLHRHAMHRTYVALPHHLTCNGWMVFNRTCCRPVASELTRPQAVTLAEALNLAATGETARSSQVKYD